MKALVYTSIFSLFYLSASSQSPLNVMTFNIRLNLASDSLDSWPHRNDLVAGQLFFMKRISLDCRKRCLNKCPTFRQEVAGETAVIVTGDFNAKPTDEPVQLLTNGANPEHITDAKTISRTPHYGPDWTFNAFKIRQTDADRID